MTATVFTRPFVRDYQRLPQRWQRQFDEALTSLLADFHYPSLHTKKMEGEYDPEGRQIWEARVSRSYRFTFAIDKDQDAYVFYRLGPHDIERHPR